MPRRKPEELESSGSSRTVNVNINSDPVSESVSAPTSAPEIEYTRSNTMTIDSSALGGADMNGDGHLSKEEIDLHLEFKRKEFEDQDAMRDAQRSMTWFALFGLLLYPFAVVIASLVGLEQASEILGDMAATYFVSVAAIVMAFFGAQAYNAKGK
jgi:hypothetical protein